MSNTEELNRYTTELSEEYVVIETDMMQVLKEQKESIENHVQQIEEQKEAYDELQKLNELEDQ